MVVDCALRAARLRYPMQDKLTLMIPGPTPVPETVLQALGRHPIGHRSADYQTSGDVLVITGSGTAAMEAGIVNVLSKGDRVLCGDNGKFGERWVKVAKAYGLDVQVIQAEWGQPLDPEAFRSALEADTAKAIKAVILTHSETSTGVINDLEAIASHVKAHGTALTIADCVTSLGACSVPMDASARICRSSIWISANTANPPRPTATPSPRRSISTSPSRRPWR
jgi:aspartate aminotransferase-like enzyme